MRVLVTGGAGPYQYPEKVITLFVTGLLAGLTVPLYGDGGAADMPRGRARNTRWRGVVALAFT